jgi:uncharacterized protein YkwD
MALYFWIFIFSFWSSTPVESGWTAADKQRMVEAVNELRSKGCNCGRRSMAPTGPVKWNDLLFTSAITQAKEMYEHDFFGHFDINGLNIGERLEKVGYNWSVAGENLGEGQLSFDEVLQDWIDSYSHCTMLMNPKVDEMAIAKHNKYWVQHFGKKFK